jgi:MFS family permease
MPEARPILSGSPPGQAISRLMLFFGIVYTVEGFCQAKAGVMWQPLTHYLKQTQGWDTVQIAASLAVLDVPWVIKPIYGIISDFLPLLGYRRRSYLLLANAGAVAAFLWTTQVLAPSAIVFALLLTAIAMAMASTVCGALLVENGQKHNASAAFINQQWLWFNVAMMVGSLLGGGVIEILPAAGAALHAAAAIAAVAPILVIVSCIALVDERHATMNVAEFRRALHGFLATFRSRMLWLIAAFLFCYYFSPGFGTPLYFHMTDTLQFSQTTIGMLSSVSAAGWIVGGLVYRSLLSGMTTRGLLYLSIVGGVLGALAYLGMVNVPSAIAISFINGVAGMIASIATLSLAAQHCPAGSEGFAFAALMSVINLAAPLSDTAGAFLYEHLFNRALAPLILLSAAFTALIFVLVPLLEKFGAVAQSSRG